MTEGAHLSRKEKQTIRMLRNSMFAMGMELDLKNIPTVDLTYQYYKRPQWENICKKSFKQILYL